MATQTIYQERRGELHQLIRGWDRRLRLQQVFTWLPRCLLPALLVGVAIAIISRLRPWLLSEQILVVTGVLLVVGIIAMILAVGLWPRPSIAAARRFDRLFGLQERVSTALELIDGRIHATDELLALQVDDAWERARTVQASESLPLPWHWREWAGVAIVALVLVLLLIIPNPQAEKIAEDSAQQAAIDAAADELREITEAVAADAALEPEDREELLQALETSTTVLEQPNVTPEEAFAALSDTQAELEEKAETLNQQANAGQAGLQSASEALQQFQPSEQVPEDAAAAAQAALQNLSENVPTMNQQQQQDAANSLQQASQAMQASNPDAAEALQQAAQSLQNGDPSQAQESLNQASSNVQQSQQSQQTQESSAQQLSDSAQSVQESADQVSQQSQQQQGQQGQEGQQGQQQSQQGDQQGQQGQDSQQQQGQQGQSNQPGQDGQPSQQGQDGQSGQPQAGQDGQSGEQEGQQGQSGQSGQGQDGQPGQQGQEGNGSGSSQEGSPNGENTSAVGGGAGDSPGGEGQEGQTAQGGQIAQDNNPDGQGEGQYDPIYAPQRLGGQSDQQVQLDGDASNAPVQEGEFSQNPDGNVSVPYNQVFSDYSDAANRALESDYIPLGLRDVVRDYFSSLEPGQNGNP
jgi:hypothetical protein